ncbi:tyrosine 2,3-aminomutase [Micromonospora lutea]|uniref:Histidine ammonia-lyase n=1 Tax=Micromonospora lutea TaxID=419825 RepID=A0ABQ4IYG6_9ACTN|nr:tyrosine 2,3-aminomutase [Micromonospora lutea]GIJ22945.1 histidine ammonia-lyase [Micromonospora lutea]
MADIDSGATPVVLDGAGLTVDAVRQVAEGGMPCVVPAASLARAVTSRQRFEDIVRQGVPVYGVTTGYGEMIYMLVDHPKEVELQTNLIRSHSAGVGPHFSEVEARAILVARLNALAKGYSAVRSELITRLEMYLNLGIIPAIPEIGSLGASGDLAPLSHIASTLLGEGYVLRDGQPVPTAGVLGEYGIEPLELRFKEGLALINGTSAMTGLGALVLGRAAEQVRQAEIVAALVIETLRGSTGPFLAEGHDLARPHPGQIDSAANMRALLDGSTLAVTHTALRQQVAEEWQHEQAVQRTEIYLQKAYSLRAVPQVLGAVRDTLAHARATVEIELNSANDNPLFFGSGEVFHGANFHGQPVAFAMDYVTIALTQLGVLSERRTNRLLNRHLSYGLPEFLVLGEPGLNSGFAGAQYPATALVAENRTIGPASIHSIPSNGDNQDIVSMGLISARNARRVLTNNDTILAVELLAAAQAVDVAGRAEGLGPAGRAAYDLTRSLAPTLREDRYMADDLAAVATALSRGELLDAVLSARVVLR